MCAAVPSNALGAGVHAVYRVVRSGRLSQRGLLRAERTEHQSLDLEPHLVGHGPDEGMINATPVPSRRERQRSATSAREPQRDPVETQRVVQHAGHEAEQAAAGVGGRRELDLGEAEVIHSSAPHRRRLDLDAGPACPCP